MIASITGYALDSFGADPRTPQALSIPCGETGTINIAVKHRDATALNLAGGQLLLTVRAGAVLVSRQATITDAANGLASFPLVIADTSAITGSYQWDVWYTDASGNRYQVCPVGSFVVTPADGAPAQPVTVPTSQTPLAQGPTGATGATGPQGPAGPAGASVTPTALKTTAYTATVGDLVRCDPTAGAFPVNLPAASAKPGLLAVKHQSASTNAVTVTPAGADTIDGVAASSTLLSLGSALSLLGRRVRLDVPGNGHSAYYGMGLDHGYSTYVYGAVGSRIYNFSDDVAAEMSASFGQVRSDLDSVIPGSIVEVEAGINDVQYAQVAGGTTTYQSYKLLVEKTVRWLRSNGAKKIIFETLSPCAAYEATHGASRVQYNNWISTLPFGIDAVIDRDTLLATAPRTAGATLQAAYDSSDGCHLSAAGESALEAAVYAVVSTL